MVERTVFADALREMSMAHEGTDRAGRPKSLCRPFLSVLPVSGAAVSTIGSGLSVATICASDSAAARIDELQIDLGEGPCWEALETGRPIIHPDLALEEQPSWPVFMKALADYEVGAVFAFPLSVGSLGVGSVDLYSKTARRLSDTEIADVTALSEVAAWQVLRRVLSADPEKEIDGDDEGDDDPSPGFSRKQVHQATGMIIAQLDVPATDALLLLRAHAFASGRTVRAVAHDVVARTLDFAAEGFGG